MKHFKAILAFSIGLASTPLHAAVFDITIDGPDAIYLAGRTDYVIPPANLPWADNNAATDDGLLRHGGPTPEEALESLPPSISVTGGDVVKVVDPAIGGINFFNGFGPPFFGPEGAGGPASSNLTSLGGLSGYVGRQGALAGVFLDASVPSLANGAPPANVNYGPNGLDFTSLSPLLRQVFYVGDGQTSGNVLQEFIAPAGATRLFFGITDGFSFVGVPGAYDDNDGSYRIRVGINADPSVVVPVPAGILMLGTGLLAFGLVRKRRG